MLSMISGCDQEALRPLTKELNKRARDGEYVFVNDSGHYAFFYYFDTMPFLARGPSWWFFPMVSLTVLADSE